MPILRHHQDKNYTVIPNAIFENQALTTYDIGLLCYMLHLPDEWVFSVRGLSAVLRGDKKVRITASLKRIEAAGYLVRTQSRGENGRLGQAVWTISDIPLADYQPTDNQPQYKYT